MELFILQNLWTLKNIIPFLLGIVAGFFLLLLIYLFAVISSMARKVKLKKTQTLDVDQSEVKWLIENAIYDFKESEKLKQKDHNTFDNLKEICKNLATNIASKFYPKSTNPLLELTVDETIILSHYIADRIDLLLQAKILKMFRGTTLKTIKNLKNTGKKITNSKAFQLAKETKPQQVFKVLRMINPIYWMKKLTVDVAVKVILKSIYLNTIKIVGQETYQIYSKKIFELDIEDSEMSFDNLQEQGE